MKTLYFLVSMLVISLQLYADDGFFDQGFVTGKKSVPSPALQETAPDIKTSDESQKDVANLLDEASGLKVYSLGLIVNGYDHKHFIKHFQTALRTAAHNDLILSSIIAVGFTGEGREAEAMPFYKRTPELFALNILGGKLYPVDTVPERFQVTTSPAWFINTEHGTVIVEGKDEIWEFFNSKGEYVEKGFQPSIQNDRSKQPPATN